MDMENEIPYMADFTPYEKMIGEYRSMAIYPKGQLWSSFVSDFQKMWLIQEMFI
ncbi:MAG: hypothetical protein CM1200mP3_00880 [Chloroflexota bacterium]|nr:MAG: hypothetical protein CM1200mP3_00880 [Chloroflexota bacterium]